MAHAPDLQAQGLLLVSGCQIHLHKYGKALSTLASVKDIARNTHDVTILGAAASNTSSVYFALGDTASAARTAEESVTYLKDSPRKDYFATALTVNGNIQFGLGIVARGTNSLTQAIAISRDAKLSSTEAFAENELAAWQISRNNLDEAEELLRRAWDVSKLSGDGFNMAWTSAHLAEIELKRGGKALSNALQNIDSALASTDERFKSEPRHFLMRTRAQILLRLGYKDKSLLEFRRAVQLADIWRQSALPGDTTNTRTVVQLDSVYHDYAQLAAQLALQRNDQVLVRDAFDVLARNRAASLREQLTRSYSSKLADSPEYFELLQQLQGAQATATLSSDSRQSDAQRQQLTEIRAKLSDLENRIGLNQQNFLPPLEKKETHGALKGIQTRLSPSEALLSFSLGAEKSFLWAVTQTEVRLYDLPRQEMIAQQAGTFSRAVSLNGAGAKDAGRVLSRSLFEKLPPSILKKRDWLLTPDGALLDKVSFCDLPAMFDGSDEPLIASHTLRILPSPSITQAVFKPATSGYFVGVADPIYNLADSRRDRKANKPVTTGSRKVLSRLPASEQEIQSSALKCGLPQSKMLTGKQASGSFLREVVARSPEILHFAVHVVSPDDFPQEAALALSLTKDNLPELLTAESAATYRVPGSLVVLSGCASQQGEVLPGAGLVGLSRGWLLAGAAAVVVSAWPTPDISGSFFPTFYNHFKQATGAVGKRAAVALQQTQLDMLRAGGYQSEPKIWAAYSIISKE